MRKFLSSGRKNKVMKNRRKRIRELEAQPGGCHFITDLLKVKDWRSWGGISKGSPAAGFLELQLQDTILPSEQVCGMPSICTLTHTSHHKQNIHVPVHTPHIYAYQHIWCVMHHTLLLGHTIPHRHHTQTYKQHTSQYTQNTHYILYITP